MLGKIVIINASLIAIIYPYNGEEGWTFRGKLCAMNYGEGQSVCVKAKDVCNWLLHSYVWGVAFNEDRKGFAGFLSRLILIKKNLCITYRLTNGVKYCV